VVNKPLAAAVKQTESYVRDELGDARSFSLDSPKSRVTRIEALRGQGAQGQGLGKSPISWK